MPKGKDFRQHLTMVPSCEVHNTAKAKDDNFAQAVITVFAAAYGGRLDQPNIHPFALHAIDKVRKGKRLRKAMIEDATPVQTPNGLRIALKPEAATMQRRPAHRASSTGILGVLIESPECEAVPDRDRLVVIGENADVERVGSSSPGNSAAPTWTSRTQNGAGRCDQRFAAGGGGAYACAE